MKFFSKIPYWKLLAIPVLAYTIGFTCNMTALISNGGTMPVLSTDGEVWQGDKPNWSKVVLYENTIFFDPIHTRMKPTDHVKWLCDIFNLHNGTYSIGDFFAMFAYSTYDYFGIAWLTLLLKKFME